MSYPTSPDYSAIKLKGVSKTVKSETRSGKVQVRTIGAQRWEFTASYKDISREQFTPVMAFIMSQDGMAGEFTVVPNVLGYPKNTVTGSAALNEARSAGATSIQIDGFTGTLSAGDFIKFANHPKVYMITTDTTAFQFTTITPPLVTSVPNNTAVIYNGVPFTVRLKNDVQEFSASGYDKYQFEVDFIEVL